MVNNVPLKDEIVDEVKTNVSNRTRQLVKKFIDIVFDCLEENVESFPNINRQILKKPEVEQEIVTLWSKYLAEEGLVPKVYSGLSDNALIANFHQEGYADGLYVGYILAMMAMVDNDVSQDIILTTRDCICSNLVGNCYDDRDKFINQYKSEKYNRINKN